MRVARLPRLERHGQYTKQVGEVTVAIPDTWFEKQLLRFVRGRWVDHHFFGRMYVFESNALTEASGVEVPNAR